MAATLKAQTVAGTAPPVAGAEPNSGFRLIQPRTMPSLTPGVLVLLEQEGRFQQAVVEGGGKSFATFFTEDGVVLSNGKPAVQGQAAIAAQAQWDPKTYQLTWNPEGARMGPTSDMGFTWGHYDGRMIDPADATKSSTTSGRYMTVWRKGKDGIWKVELEASADDAPASADCCTVPHP